MVYQYKSQVQVRYQNPDVDLHACRKKGRCVQSEESRRQLGLDDVTACEACDILGECLVEAKFKARYVIKEPVGSRLADVLHECGVVMPADCPCRQWIMQMNFWGLDGCETNRQKVTDRLREASKEASWLTMLKVAARGYLTIDSLLDEALRRVRDEVTTSSGSSQNGGTP